MITRVVIEQFYENFEEATIGKWLKTEGDSVAKKESLVELITDKVTFEFESPAAGTLLRIVSPEKSVVPVGYVIAVLGDPDEEVPPVEAENEALLEKKRRQEAAEATPPIRLRTRSRSRVRATPKARRMAREAGVELEAVAKATGAAVVTEAAIERFLAERK